ncbi:hypothetical protein [Longispora albida]|uniref:hypothetical protein n=1 Tax=Longispora albida TaxID=203523 RepID=UPI0012F8216F|nr:hypothetical protein [Longispora albida]
MTMERMSGRSGRSGSVQGLVVGLAMLTVALGAVSVQLTGSTRNIAASIITAAIVVCVILLGVRIFSRRAGE